MSKSVSRSKAMLAAGTTLLATGMYLMGAATSLAQDKKVELKLSYWVPPSHMLTPGYKEWDEALKKATNGTLSITLYPSSQLGSGKDHYDMVRRGIADIGLINPGYTPGRFPVISTADLPFVISHSLKAAAALTRWYKKYALKEMRDVIVCHTFAHEPGTFHTKKVVKVPDDIKGLKIRTANATTASYVTAIGANSVQVPIMEAFETLNRGITDGITVPWSGITNFNFGKVVKFHLDAPVYVSTFVHTINKRTYDRLSANQKKALDATCTPEWSQKIYRFWSAEEDEIQAKVMKDPEHTTTKIGKPEIALWHKAAAPVLAQWGASVKKAGYNPDQVLKELKDELRKEGILFGE